MTDTPIIVGTIVIVAIAVIICYVIDKHVKSYLKKFADSQEQNETATFAKVAEGMTVAFEEALRRSFNEAIEDGIITKEEALKIVTDTFTAVKNEFIKSSKSYINNERPVLDSLDDDEDVD